MANLIRRVRHWLWSRREEDALREELEFHEDMKRRELERGGLSAAQAHRAARRAMGNVSLAREDARAVWTWTSVEQLGVDTRYALRALASRPGFSATAVALLALGVGIATAMSTIVDALLFRPVPFRAPTELAAVAMMTERGGPTTVSPAVLRAWRDSPAFAGAEGALTDTAIVEIDGAPQTRGIAHVTPGLFDLLGGVRPLHGRLFDPSEGRGGQDDRVLLSEELWLRAYGGDPAIVGRHITVDGEPLVVVGIVPAEFRFPNRDTVLWRAVEFDAPPPRRAADRPVAYVRFSREMPRDDALRLATAAARGADASNAEREARPLPIAGLAYDWYSQRAVPLLMGGVLLVFLVLCANLSSLLLSRLTARRREFSMRSTLGASRARLMRQAFLECLLLGGTGVIAGLALATWLVALAHAFLPDAFLLRTLNPMHIDARALAVASLAGLLATFGAGLLPAWLGTRVDAGQSLRVVERGGTETRGARAVTSGLLVVEVALACTLLVGAALLVRSFVNLAGADRGLDPRGIVVANMSLPVSAFSDRASRETVAALIEEEVKQLPGVQQVAWSYGVPPRGGAFSWGEWTSDAPGTPVVDMTVDHYYVGPEFFALYGVSVLRGRAFQPDDDSAAVIVSERLAYALWPNLDPLGRTFRHDNEQFRVIGLAGEIHHPSLESNSDNPEYYRAFSGVSNYPMLSIRCGAACPPSALIHQRIAAVHPGLQAVNVRPLELDYLEALARPRATAALGFAFAAIAVLAAAGGLFSVLSYAVARRQREFGIRTALGASPRQIGGIVLRDGLRVAVTGVAIGSVSAWIVARALASLQYGVAPHDPVSWSVVPGLLGLTTLLASWRPAREAMQVDPVRLLREE
jgi:putative ABC transport system permease protein